MPHRSTPRLKISFTDSLGYQEMVICCTRELDSNNLRNVLIPVTKTLGWTIHSFETISYSHSDLGGVEGYGV